VGRSHVVRAATLSVSGVLRAFVLGARDGDHELEIWRALPFVIEAPDLPSLADRILAGREGETSPLHPLGAINWPARKDRVIDVRSVITGPIDGGRRWRAALPRVAAAGGHAYTWASALVPHGDRDLHFVAIGVTSQLGLTRRRPRSPAGAAAIWEVQTDTASASGRLPAQHRARPQPGPVDRGSGVPLA
jgi:hypothetical protein